VWYGVWNVAPDALIPAHLVFQGSFRDTQVHFTNFQNLILKAKINPVPVLGRRHHANDLRQTLAKSMPAQNCEPGVLAQNALDNGFFWRGLENARETSGQRDFNRP
jgi:hypothetical protein